MAVDIELVYTKNSAGSYQIVSDFPLSQQESSEWTHGRGTPRKSIHGTGTVGSGENQIRIKTVNGNVYLKRGG